MAMRIGIAAGAAIGLIAGLAGIYVLRTDESKVDATEQRKETIAEAREAQEDQGGISRKMARGTLAAFVVKPERKPVPDVVFSDNDGRQMSLEQWRGRVVLLNLWATWCAPCRKEMPALARLQSEMGSKDFEVVALSVDRKGLEASSSFLIETGATALKVYNDKSAEAVDTLDAIGLPATLLIDRQGREIGRLLGPAEWDSPEAVNLIKAAIAEDKTS